LNHSVDLNHLLPADAAYMARTDLWQTRLLGFTEVNLEAVTGFAVGFLGPRPAVRHHACATDRFFELMELAGQSINERTLCYRTEEEAHQIAHSLVRKGYRLLSAYPMPAQHYRDDMLLVGNALWRQLNAKNQLHQLARPEHLATRRQLTFRDARRHTIRQPVWLKAADDIATGWGYAVRCCIDQNSYLTALDELDALNPGGDVLLEQHVAVCRSWCANMIISSKQVVFAGAAQQLFTQPGKQSGSLIDNDQSPPSSMASLVCDIGERARQAGFQGVAGCDIGEKADGRLVVFDPNFRFNSSSPQVLLHASATARTGTTVSQSVSLHSLLRFPEIAVRLREWIKDGHFIPIRALDAELLPAAQGQSTISGFVTAKNRNMAEAMIDRLRNLMAP
jgi:hypothetical protein